MADLIGFWNWLGIRVEWRMSVNRIAEDFIVIKNLEGHRYLRVADA